MCAALAVSQGEAARGQDRDWLEWRPVDGPCAGDCAASLYAGWYVGTPLGDALLTADTPLTWDYSGDHLVGAAASRRIATLWGRIDVEPELGVGQRFGDQDETEIWGAIFLRYSGFPWDRWLVTTVALSSGLNYASAVSDKERDRARDGEGTRWMHFLAPEITFAAPQAPQYELLFRLHHRSGVFGLVSDAWGGAQYGVVGLRVRF